MSALSPRRGASLFQGAIQYVGAYISSRPPDRNTVQQQENSYPDVEIWSIIANTVKRLRASMLSLSHLVGLIDIVLGHFVTIFERSCHSSSEPSTAGPPFAWADVAANAKHISDASVRFLLSKTDHERILYSIQDHVDENFKRKWRDDLNSQDSHTQISNCE